MQSRPTMADRLVLRAFEDPEAVDALERAIDLGALPPSLAHLLLDVQLHRSVELVAAVCSRNDRAMKAVSWALAQSVLDRPANPTLCGSPGPKVRNRAAATGLLGPWVAEVHRIGRDLHNNDSEVVYGLDYLAGSTHGKELAAAVRQIVLWHEPDYFQHSTVGRELKTSGAAITAQLAPGGIAL